MIGLFAATTTGRRAAAEVAARLGPRAVVVDGPVAAAVRRTWDHLDAAVFFLASGAALRLVAPLLGNEHTDPGVVCVDDSAQHAIALLGGRAGGANELAEQVGAVLGATPVITTSGDAIGSTPVDEVVDVLDAAVDGDLTSCGEAVLNGDPVLLVNPHGFPLPALPSNMRSDVQRPRWTVVVDDRHPVDVDARAANAVVRLIPRTLIVGIGAGTGVSRAAVTETLARLESEHGLDLRAIRAFATVDHKSTETGVLQAIQDLGFWHSADGGEEIPLHTQPAEQLATVDVPTPSETARAEVGTPSVAEAAALRVGADLAHGSGVRLVVGKLRGGSVTVAAARVEPRGRLALLGLGPGPPDLRTPRADAELRRASVVVGLDEHVDQVRHLLRPGAEVRSSGTGQNEQRASAAVAAARAGNSVVLIGADDAGVFGAASLALEVAGSEVEVVGIPGITDVLGAAALLGAPLGHDYVLINLSESCTPWEVIERRVRAAAEADLVLCFSHPCPDRASDHLTRALGILTEARPATTPVGAVHRANRVDQRVWCAPIAEFDPGQVDAHTTVVVGSSQSAMFSNRFVTAREYRWMTSGIE